MKRLLKAMCGWKGRGSPFSRRNSYKESWIGTYEKVCSSQGIAYQQRAEGLAARPPWANPWFVVKIDLAWFQSIGHPLTTSLNVTAPRIQSLGRSELTAKTCTASSVSHQHRPASWVATITRMLTAYGALTKLHSAPDSSTNAGDEDFLSAFQPSGIDLVARFTKAVRKLREETLNQSGWGHLVPVRALVQGYREACCGEMRD